MATGTRSPFAADAPDFSYITPYQRVRTGPDPQGTPQERRDLANIIAGERRWDQKDNVDRASCALIDIRQLNVVAQLPQAAARLVQSVLVDPGQMAGFTPQPQATRRHVRHISWSPGRQMALIMAPASASRPGLPVGRGLKSSQYRSPAAATALGGTEHDHQTVRGRDAVEGNKSMVTNRRSRSEIEWGDGPKEKPSIEVQWRRRPQTPCAAETWLRSARHIT